MHTPAVITYQSCGFDKKRQVSNELVSFWCTRWGFAVSASQNLGKASSLRFSHEPWLLTFTAGYKKHPIWGCFGVPAGVRTQTRRRRRP